MDDADQIINVLLRQRPIHVELGLDVLEDFGRQLATGLERIAGRRAHHEEGRRDHQKQGRDGDQQAAQKQRQQTADDEAKARAEADRLRQAQDAEKVRQADLVRQGLRPPLAMEMENGLLAPVLPKDSPLITLEHTLAIEDDID